MARISESKKWETGLTTRRNHPRQAELVHRNVGQKDDAGSQVPQDDVLFAARRRDVLRRAEEDFCREEDRRF